MAADQRPAITVIVPTHNRASTLRHCLSALAHQDFAGRFDVVVVMDGCVDDSARVVAEASRTLPVRGIEQRQQGPAAARNRGAAEARGAALLFIDDDIVLAPGAVRAHAEAQERGPSLVIGPIETVALRPGLPTRSVEFWRAIRRRHESGLPPTFLDVFTGNLSVPADAFRAAGGFDEKLRRSEDIELGYRLTRTGLPVVYAGGAAARQEFTKKTAEVLRDAEGYGRANVTLWESYPAMRPFLHIGGVTSGIGWRSRLLPVIAGWPLPMALFRLLGAIPDRVPGTGTLSTWSQAYWRVRGVRKAVADKRTWRRMTARLRILRFAFPENASPSREQFASQLDVLRRLDVEVVSLGEYLCQLRSAAPPERDSVVITVDGPLTTLEEVAFPALAAAGLPATAFVDAAEIDAAKPPPGIEPGLSGEPQRVSGVLASRGATFAAYAYGPGIPTVAERAFARGAGFQAACTQRAGIIGWRTDPHLLPRVTVPPDATAAELRWMVRFGAPAAGLFPRLAGWLVRP